MKVILGSQNIPKRDAVAEAFGRSFPEQQVEVVCVSTESGVASHPLSAEESLTGAMNRLHYAKQAAPGADYYVGIEGGLLHVDGRAWEIGWVAISNLTGKVATGLSSGVELSGKILESVKAGQELSDVLEDIYGNGRIGDSNGFNGLSTNDLVTRQMAYEQGIIFALAQFLHPELF